MLGQIRYLYVHVFFAGSACCWRYGRHDRDIFHGEEEIGRPLATPVSLLTLYVCSVFSLACNRDCGGMLVIEELHVYTIADFVF